MRTHPIVAKDGTRLFAFEIENVYISPAIAAQLLAQIDGVTDVSPRKMFAKSSDVRVEFNYLGKPYIVWEPYGDSSRYWIGPKESLEGSADIAHIEDAFKHYRPSFHRAIVGDVLTLRFITRFLKK